MPYLFKLSKRVAQSRCQAVILAIAVALACDPSDPSLSSPTDPSYATTDLKPAAVSDLTVAAVTDTSATLSFTEVDDGLGNPSSYDVRYAVQPISWGFAPGVTRGTCTVPVRGSVIGARRSCTVLGLSPATRYQFQLVPFRGTLSVDGVFGPLSSVADGFTRSVGMASPLVLMQEGFEDAHFATRGWYDNMGMVTTTTQRVSGSGALEARFVVGGKTPTWGGAARHLFRETESVYLSYWVKYSTNWVGSGRPYHPHEFMLLTNEDGPYSGLSFTHLTAYVEHGYQDGAIPVLQLQDGANVDQSRIGQDLTGVTEQRAAAGCNGSIDGHPSGCYDQGGGSYTNEKKFSAARPYFAPNPGPGYKGDWHFVEAYFKLNSIENGKGVPNGVVRYWFDGQLVIDRTNVLVRTGAHPNQRFNQLVIAPWIGDGSPVDQTMWVDELTVATDRIAGGSSGTVSSVTINPSSGTAVSGGTYQFAAALRDGAGNVLSGPSVTWASSNATVATVSGTGLASTVAAGSATITATSGDITGTATLMVTAPTTTNPGAVTDLNIAGVTDSSIAISFTEVNDGAGRPASYDVRFAASPLSWGSAVAVGLGTCAAPVVGNAIGARRTCTVLGLSASTAYSFQLVAFRGTLNVNAVFGGLSNVASGSTAAVTVPSSTPGAVSDLSVVGATDSSVTLSFTEVSDGAGRPASYDVRFAIAPLAWGSASTVSRGTCAVPLAGASLGARRTCTVLGLSGSTAYGFQLVAFHGTLNVNAVFGSLSNVASGATTGRSPSGSAWPNEPAGATVFGEQAFNTLTTSDWHIVDNGNGYGSIVSDATAPLSPTAVLQYRYPAGFSGGDGPAAVWRGLPNVRQVFVGLRWKVSNPWHGHASNVNKIAFLFPGSGGDIYIAMYGPPGGPYELRVLPQFPGLPSNWLMPNVARVPVTLGTWHRIEWLVDYNGGVVKWWLDGQLIGSHSGVPFPSAGMVEFKMSSTWGGVGDAKAHTDYYWFDHARLSGR